MGAISLRTRLGIGATLLAAGTLLTAGILWYGMGEVARRLDKALAADARMATYAALSNQTANFLVVATEAVQRELPPETRRERLEPVENQLRRTFAALQADVGRAVDDAGALGIDEQSRIATQSLGLARMSALLESVSRALASDSGDPAALRASIDIFSSSFDPLLSQAVNEELLFRSAILTSIDDLRRKLRLTAFAIAGLTLLAVATFYFLLIRPLFARLERLRTAARQIGGEDFGVGLPENEQDEIGQLYSETNRMAAALTARRDEVQSEWGRLNETIAERTEALRAANKSLAEIDENRRRFFADVSHELRTPLTVILMEAEIGASGDGGARSAFATIASRAKRLTRRIEDLLRVARSETGRLQLDPAPVALADLIDLVRAECAPEVDNAGMTLDVDAPPEVTLEVDPNWIRQILVSLVRNAIRHARGGGWIGLAAQVTEEGVEISVTDRGPGIAAEDQSRVFDRFQQGGAQNAQGFGLGLALVRWVVEEHGGQIGIDSPPKGGDTGTKISVRLPVAA